MWFGDTRRRRAYRHDDDTSPWLDTRRRVATVQFSRAAGRRPQDLRDGLSKLNSMHQLELGGMPRWPGQVRSTY